jgi:hypothetical protein
VLPTVVRHGDRQRPEHVVSADELAVVCAVCDRPIIVCCYVDDVDPETYRCLDCRTVKHEKPVAVSGMGAAMARAQQAAGV